MKLPRPFIWLWEGWKYVSRMIGVVMSFIVLTILWAIIFGFYALIMKCVKLVKHAPAPVTYWHETDPDYPQSLSHGF